MTEAALEARAEGLILRGLGDQLLQSPGVVNRLDKDRLFLEGEADDIDGRIWNRVCRHLIGEGRILVYKVHDLPNTLPLKGRPLTGYTTREHLLELLRTARPDQSEEIRDFLKFQGVEVPADPEPAVTSTQRKRIDAAVRKLNEVRAEVADLNPDNRVVWYLDASHTLSLLVEPKGHSGPDPQHIAHSTTLKASSGGDW